MCVCLCVCLCVCVSMSVAVAVPVAVAGSCGRWPVAGGGVGAGAALCCVRFGCCVLCVAFLFRARVSLRAHVSLRARVTLRARGLSIACARCVACTCCSRLLLRVRALLLRVRALLLRCVRCVALACVRCQRKECLRQEKSYGQGKIDGYRVLFDGTVISTLQPLEQQDPRWHDQATRGQVIVLSETEARLRYPNLVIASLGAQRKEKPGGKITARVLFDGTHGLSVNSRTRIRDHGRRLRPT